MTCNVIAATETYRGESFRLERREWWTPARAMQGGSGIGRVWCWEILSGPGRGNFGGKCATKAEARQTAKSVIRAATRSMGGAR